MGKAKSMMNRFEDRSPEFLRVRPVRGVGSDRKEPTPLAVIVNLVIGILFFVICLAGAGVLGRVLFGIVSWGWHVWD